ncbi:HNH endonuclease [Corynebacterium sp. TAE3-ERU12]|uniref:HNH endonuclease signature motif containing protein n=1 Tax=Corynebacterium sp. TAE3-ERU12 TaxID=2849491 RepID=UPI001C438E3D|nr:HNH endonuclease signature motif containing protein [Corynebacterium sp. TAE3-ERU12]MBV7295611.1 HNH endonuclease [Corynebacterium sp. TAE3-ERU12]
MGDNTTTVELKFAHELGPHEATPLILQRNRTDMDIARLCVPNPEELIAHREAKLSMQLGISLTMVGVYSAVGYMLQRLPQLAEVAQTRGHLPLRYLEIIAEATQTVDEEHLPTIDEKIAVWVLPKHNGQRLFRPNELAKAINKIVGAVAPLDVVPEDIEKDQVEQVCNFEPFRGTSRFDIRLAPDRATEFVSTIKATAEKHSCSYPDALMHIVRGTADVRVVLNVYRSANDLQAWMPGAGWLSEVATEQWMKRASALRLLADGDSDARFPTPAQRAMVTARDGHCQYPGCTIPADRCDVDHILPWPEGPTSTDNLQLLCRRHHVLKTSKLWQVERTPDGAKTWNSADGATAVSLPAGPMAKNGYTTWSQSMTRLARTRRAINKELIENPPAHTPPPPPPLTAAEEAENRKRPWWAQTPMLRECGPPPEDDIPPF